MRSIRWRMTLSYGGIALLTAAVLGGVLLGVLRAQYRARERAYLEDNARFIASELSIRSRMPAKARSSQVQGYAFLAQARVRLLDDRGRVTADSGPPANQRLDVMVTGAIASQEATSGAFGTFVSIRGSDTSGTPVPLSASVHKETSTVGEPETEFGLSSEEGVLPATAEATGAAPIFVASRTGPAGFFGFGPSQGGLSTERSGEKVRYEYVTRDGSRGTVELSEGPAYGTEIVRGVAVAWALSGLVAVLLAGFAGVVVSRRMSAPVITLTGVTERMASGDLSARVPEESRDELGALARSFNDMAGRVQETVETLRRFVADAAHELSTPLTALHANLELLTGADVPPNAAARAIGQVERLEHLTRLMLDLSRIETGAGARERLDLSLVVHEAAEAVASRAEQADICLKVDVPEGGLQVVGDRTQLLGAVGNLLDNALKFTPSRGHVGLALRFEGEFAEVIVEDDGIGIPEEDLPLLFSRFHRGRNASGYPGSGLGLAIVKATAEAHGGSARAESSRGGTRMTMRIRRL